jgi:putative copper resistance protein D
MDVGGAVIAARFVFFVAASLAFGTALFTLYAGRWVDDRDAAWGRAVVLWASLSVLVAAIAWLAFAIRDFGGDDLPSFVSTGETVLFATAFGPAWLARLAAAAALLAAAALWPSRLLLVALAAVLLGTESFIGHAAVGGTGHRIAELAHILSAAAWLGGLLPLARALATGMRGPAAATRARRILFRFSAVGMVAVMLIAATGVLNRLYVAGPAPELGSDYDRFFIAKIVLFLAMVGAALFNRFRLVPALADVDARPAVLRRFRSTVLAEQGLGVLLLLIASFLGMTSPPDKAEVFREGSVVAETEPNLWTVPERTMSLPETASSARVPDRELPRAPGRENR